MPIERTPRRRGPRRARRWALVLLGLAIAGSAAAPAAEQVRRASLGEGTWAVLQSSTQLFVESQAQPGETLTAFARRLTGRTDAASRIARANGGTTRLRPGPRYRVPLELLRADLRPRALRALFPADRADASGWRHRAQGEALWHVALWFTGRGENFPALRRENRLRDDDLRWGQVIVVPPSLLSPELRPVAPVVAREQKQQEKKLRVEEDRSAVVAQKPAVAAPASAPARKDEAAPSTRADVPAPGALAVVPGAIVETGPSLPAPERDSELGPPRPASGTLTRTDLPAAIVAPVPQRRAPAEPTAATVPASIPAPPATGSTAVGEAGEAAEAAGPHRLTYGRDAQGEYAAYALRGGEALYSAVVVRFTGRTLADDVNALAAEVARRSGIDDVTSIPIGYAVKIPLELVQPEFLPPGNPRRLEYEAAQNATRKFRNQVTALDLEGITVVLDAGHGGVDTGAMFAGVWESTYVYDIVLRIKRLLEMATAARVIPTTRDGGEFRIEDRDVLGFSRGRSVLTSPPYPIEDSKVGVNLRWYLANSVERAATQRGAPAEKTVFVSVHADSLHPSLRGAMVYVPDAQMSGDAFERVGPEYAARREVRENPSAALERKERQRSEGLSRDLAEHIVAGFRDAQLAVDPYKPVREHVIRRGRSWVPAVLRYNTVPAKVLVEVCNLGNGDDRTLIQTRAFRQKVAEAIVAGLRGYFGKVHTGEPQSTQQIAKATAKR